MRGWRLAAAAAAAAVAGIGPVAAEEAEPRPAVGSSTVTADHAEVRQWFRMGDVARQLEDYDLAITVYQRIIERFPDTRWARQAESALTALKAEASMHLAPWDAEVGGTRGAVQAQKLLNAGDIADQMDDAVIALKFYERAQHAAPDSRYARQAASKMRWIRRWKNPGP